MISKILGKLNKVKKRSYNSWIACCPAHPDKAPSLSIKETSDGKILLHCFTGCSVDDIANSLGIEVTDLFPKIEIENEDSLSRKKQRFTTPPTPWPDMINALQRDLYKVLILTSHLARGNFLNKSEQEELTTISVKLYELITQAQQETAR